MSADSATPVRTLPANGWRHNAQTYLALIDRGRNSLALTLTGCVLILLSWFGLGVPLYFLLEADTPPGSLIEFVSANLGILAMLVGLMFAVVKLQRRPMLTLITPRTHFDWYRAWQGFAVCFVLAAISLVIEYLFYPARFSLNVDLNQWLLFAPVVLLFTPLQAATEELVFRGYLMQSLRTFTSSTVLIVAFSSVLFMVPHLANPEAELGVLVVLDYVLIGAFFALVTLRDGRLELAIGAHAATNIFIALVASHPHSVLATPALVMADTLDPAFSLMSVIAMCIAFYAWFFWRSGSRRGVFL